MVSMSLKTLLASVLIAADARVLNDKVGLNGTWDYIIVGGGTSGLTVADRLSENGKHSVLVLEYGPLNPDPSILLPSDTLVYHPDRFYNITSLPIPGLNNLTSLVAVGALVGGGSAVNGMFFDRGSASDYDAWETLGNGPAWNFQSLLPYFKKSVTFTPPTAAVAETYNYTWDVDAAYGGSGPVQVSFPPYQFPGQEFLWAGWEELGVKKPKEAAAGEAIGAIQAPSALNPVRRTRSYARTAHYERVANRTNLRLVTGVQVREVVFKNGGGNGTGLEATGVKGVNRYNVAETFEVNARKEVIVAAGAVWTPWLLQRSGIGPKSVLEKAGISVKKNLPGVGANFQDHAIGGGQWNWTKNVPSPTQMDVVTNTTFFAEAKKEYDQSRTGPLTVARGNQAAFLPLKVVAAEKWKGIVDAVAAQDSSPYLPATYEATLIAGYKAQQKLTAELLARDDSATYEFPFSGGPLGNGVLERPLSRGTILINTTDPSASPVVDFRTFSNPIDLQVAVSIVQFVRKFNALNAFTTLGAVEVSPGANVTSDAAIASFLRGSFTPTFAHPAGTASMMPEQHGGVVDPELQVYGVERLSIVDASVIPYLPATHICTTVYAIAEKAADLIKKRTAWAL
ncbi:choline dehydrogenase [Setomelanomma holmii]|uniref:Choline dehydrogenase n=1 Tax=Setomelanomma holmii TaxID=210430 RepID=A0A9P4H6D0_9PLEO|nr:choline dehydrogenase [Setomelanomma holmii]